MVRNSFSVKPEEVPNLNRSEGKEAKEVVDQVKRL